jgi:prephenate dehydrogenase
MEVGLRHMYSGKVHFGILESLSPDFVILKENNRNVELKLSNIEVLSGEELKSWKTDNLPLKKLDVSVVLPETSQPELISRVIRSVEGVVSSEVKDVYRGGQIPEGKKSITFTYQVLSLESMEMVQELLTGFGGIIR